MKNKKSELVELRKAYGEALLKLGHENDKVVVLDADVSHHTGTHNFEEEFPERFFQMGIAEQNMMCVASGLATCGFVPFANSFAVFASKRPHDQISISVAYPNLNVKIVGSYSGLSTPNTGATHQAIDDIATMRSTPNMKVVVPADAVEVEKAVFAIAKDGGPVYLRLARSPAVPTIFEKDYNFELGQAVSLRDGSDVTLIGTGIMTARCLEAAELLEKDQIKAAVLHIPTIKPIDMPKVIEAAEKTGAIVTVENHSIVGGLGSAVSEVLSEHRPCPLQRIGIVDTFCESAEDVELLFTKYGLTSENIVEGSRKVMDRKSRTLS